MHQWNGYIVNDSSHLGHFDSEVPKWLLLHLRFRVKVYLNDDGDGQVDVVRVHEADCEAGKPCKRPMHRPLPEHLPRNRHIMISTDRAEKERRKSPDPPSLLAKTHNRNLTGLEEGEHLQSCFFSCQLLTLNQPLIQERMRQAE
jgi:hypothetical protein